MNKQLSTISHDSNIYQTEGDFNLITSLLKRAPYRIPDHLRTQVISSVANVLGDPEAPLPATLAASRLLIEMDKCNINLIKAAIPKQHVHRQAKDLTNEELEAVVLSARNLIEDADFRETKSG